MMRRFIQATLRKIGIDMLSLNYSKQFLYDHLLNEVLKKHSIQTVMDIGANDGRFGTFLRKNGYRGKIHSFEPVSSTFDRLAVTAKKAPPWSVHNFALGQHEDLAAINVMVGDDLCSFLEPSENSSAMTKIRTETVLIRRLDDFAEPIDWRKTFIKIDTQGFDFAVLQGGEQVIKRVPLLQTEISFLPIYREMRGFFDVMKWLRERDFDVIGMFAVSRDAHYRVREFDCVLVNRRFIRKTCVPLEDDPS